MAANSIESSVFGGRLWDQNTFFCQKRFWEDLCERFVEGCRAVRITGRAVTQSTVPDGAFGKLFQNTVRAVAQYMVPVLWLETVNVIQE